MKKWIKAARLRTLPLSISGIILGTACAYPQYHLQRNYWAIFGLCLLTTLFFQVLSNYANDYGDAVKGTDNENRTGPKRAVQSGEITASEMKNAIVVMSVLSFISSLAVIFVSFGADDFLKAAAYLFLALACIGASIKYTVGSSAYGYRGLGDVFVFVFFGLVSTLGSFYLYGHSFNVEVLFPAVAVGLLSTAVLNMNNMRDVHNDAAMGKNTLVVKIGYEKAKAYHYSLIVIAVIFFNTYALAHGFVWYSWIFILGYIPLLKNLTRINQVTHPRDLDPELKRISLATFFISLLFSIAIIIN